MNYAKLDEKKETNSDIEIGCIRNTKLRNRLHKCCNWGILLTACFVLLCFIVKVLTVFHEFDHNWNKVCVYLNILSVFVCVKSSVHYNKHYPMIVLNQSYYSQNNRLTQWSAVGFDIAIYQHIKSQLCVRCQAFDAASISQLNIF